MKRIEIIVHKDYYDSVMRYLREARVLELLDVKEMMRGYEGAVSPCPTSERLYELVSIGSKITSLINALHVGTAQLKPVQVTRSLSEETISKIEERLASIERDVTALTSETQVYEKIVEFADSGLSLSVKEIMKISDPNAPEGRHRLEEIIFRIFDALAPAQAEQPTVPAETAQRKDIIESVRRAIADQLAQLLASGKGERTIIEALSDNLDLMILPGSSARDLRFDPRSRIEVAREQVHERNRALQKLASENAEWLQVTGELVNAERVLEEAKAQCGKTESTYVIEGWLPANKIPDVQTSLGTVSEGHCVVQEWSGKNSPTMLRNPRGTGLFQRLTLGFGTPASTEIDPTILWIITYPLFFGLMFGDVGHGLIFMFVSAGLLFAKKRGVRFEAESLGGLGGLFNMILEGAGLLVLGGAAATVCGFLYGTVMGSEEWFHKLTGLEGPLWFDPFKHPMTLLKVSIIIGIAHVSSGLILDIVNKVRNRDYQDLLAGPGLWLWFYLVLGYLILTYGFGLISYALSNIVIVLVLLGLPSALMLAAKVRMEGPFEGVGHWMESMLASISHTISYMRIMAMKMIHDVFSLLFLGILFSLPIYVGVPIFGLLTMVMIMILESAFVFLQDLRLHWVEWFLKFYSGSGTPFKPFGVERTYTRVSVAV